MEPLTHCYWAAKGKTDEKKRNKKKILMNLMYLANEMLGKNNLLEHVSLSLKLNCHLADPLYTENLL